MLFQTVRFFKGEDYMKIRRMISIVLAMLILVSVSSVAASAGSGRPGPGYSEDQQKESGDQGVEYGREFQYQGLGPCDDIQL